MDKPDTQDATGPNATVESENESRSVVSDSLRPHGLYSPWNSPGQNTGVGSLSLLQGIFPTQESNPGLLCLLYWQADSLPLSQLGSPVYGAHRHKEHVESSMPVDK